MSDTFDVPGAVCTKQTSKAILVHAKDLGKGDHWIPQSAVHDDSEVYDAKENATGKLVIAGWFARSKGWL